MQREPRAPGAELWNTRSDLWTAGSPGYGPPQGGSQLWLVCEGLALLRSKGPVGTKNLRRVSKDPSVFEQKALATHGRQAATPSACPASPPAHASVLPPGRAVPACTETPGDAGPGTQARSSFLQAHRVTSAHMHAARCYLCNHISAQPQILPYKDIGSHGCVLFMVFHTHTRTRRATVLPQLHMHWFFPRKAIRARSPRQTQALLVQH